MNSKFYYSDKRKLIIYILDAKFNKETLETLTSAFDKAGLGDYRTIILPAGTEVIDMDTKEDDR